MPHKPSTEEIINRAGRQHITAEELDILVSDSNNNTGKLERDVSTLRNKLDQVERQLDK